MTDIIAGADGCRAGWVVVQERFPDGGLSWEVVPSISDLLRRPESPSILAMDIPIGLPLLGPRACDLEARRLLGPRRGTSVFPAPIRAVVDAESYSDASNARRQAEGKGMSRQAWGIVPKIRDVDTFLQSQPLDQSRVREVHPEVCFFFMADRRPMESRKRRLVGRNERAALLRAHFGDEVDSGLALQRSLGCASDDLLDALAALWTARRIRAGTAVTHPASPPRDSIGLRMEIVA